MSDWNCATFFFELRTGELRSTLLLRTRVNKDLKSSGWRLGLGRCPLLRCIYSAGLYSVVAPLGVFEEWAFRLSSATPRASSSSFASCAMFHTWAIITGQKNSRVIAVG